MRRLKKKAWDKITLYHATSSQVLLNIVNEGQLIPGGYINQTSNGAVDIDGNVSPSGEQTGVYLADEDNLAFYYDEAVNATHFDESRPNIPVTLIIDVDTDALVPDYDDLKVSLDYQRNNGQGATIEEIKDELLNGDEPLWRQSLDQIGQVVHQGPIDVSQITGVKFILNNYLVGSGKMYSMHPDDIKDMFNELGIQDSVKMSLDNATSILNNLYDFLDAEEQVQLVASIKRLIKRF